MGNQAHKAADNMSSAASNVKKRMTIRRRRPDLEDDFSADEISRKFNNIPTLTESEKHVLRTSWDLISKKVDQVSF